MRPHNAAAFLLHMKDVLGLSENQVKELKALRDAYRAENTVNEAKLKVAKEELKEILFEDHIDLERAEAKIKEMTSLETSVRISFAKQLAKIKTIVPKEQFKKLHEGKQGHRRMHENSN